MTISIYRKLRTSRPRFDVLLYVFHYGSRDEFTGSSLHYTRSFYTERNLAAYLDTLDDEPYAVTDNFATYPAGCYDHVKAYKAIEYRKDPLPF